MKPTTIFVACCLALPLTPAGAGTEDWGARRTVQGLYRDCKSDGAVGQAACARYLQGFLDAVRIGGALLSSARVTREDDADTLVAMFACSHAAVSWQDVKQAFLRWMERNPTQTRTHAAIGVWAALNEPGVCGAPWWPFGKGNILDKALISRLPPDFH